MFNILKINNSLFLLFYNLKQTFLLLLYFIMKIYFFIVNIKYIFYNLLSQSRVV